MSKKNQNKTKQKVYKYKREILVQSGLNISHSVLVLCGLSAHVTFLINWATFEEG